MSAAVRRRRALPSLALCYKVHMATAGIRELRQRASDLVRRVEQGETIEITDRGRPVALLSPLPGGALERLRATGDLEPAKGDVDELPPPLLVPSDVEKPSSVLARLRVPER
jgi:prevent-host-death family protein